MEKAKICRFFQNGRCKLKSECPFVHKKQFKKICKFFKQGTCKKGQDCDFYHQVEDKPIKYQIFNENINAKQHKQYEIKEQKLPQQKQPQPIKSQQQIQKQLQEKRKRLQQLQRLQKAKAIDKILGIKTEKVQQQPQINYSKKILVSFTQLIKTQEGKQNVQRINSQIFGNKPYLQYLKSLENDNLKQMAQIIRKYQYSFKYLNEQMTKFEVKFCPALDNKQMKLNFDISQHFLLLQVTNKAKIQLINKSIPEYFRQQINRKIEIIKQSRSLYQTLKYIQNKFQLICEQVDFILENKKFNQKDLAFEFDGGFQQQQQFKKKQSKSQNIIKKQQEKQLVEEKQIVPQIQLNNTIFLQTLQTNAQTLFVQQILLHLVCECEAMITYILKGKNKKNSIIRSKIKCSKCKQIITIYLKREILHKDAKQIIGKVGCIGARLEDAGAILWKINCICQNVITSTELSLSGIKKIVKCFDCFREYFIQYFGIFREIPYLREQKQNKPKFDQNKNIFKLDTELPNKGICKHAKFSFRFFRFPCCGRAFPCQNCHQQKTDKHDYQRASVMICGYCSCQQMLTDICKRCKKQLVKGSEKSGHWQGGKGCRDQTLLSKNDPKKYTGQNKTISNNRKTEK